MGGDLRSTRGVLQMKTRLIAIAIVAAFVAAIKITRK